MTLSFSRPRFGWLVTSILLGNLLSPDARADGPSYAYVDYGRQWGRTQSDRTADGHWGKLSMPLSDVAFLSVAGTAVETDPFDLGGTQTVEERQRGLAGLGIHAKGPRAHSYLLLGYAHRRTRFLEGTQTDWDESDGAGLEIGGRWLLGRNWMLENEGQIDAFAPDWTVDLSWRVKLSVQLIPHVWLVGGYSGEIPFSDDRFWTAGARLSL